MLFQIVVVFNNICCCKGRVSFVGVNLSDFFKGMSDTGTLLFLIQTAAPIKLYLNFCFRVQLNIFLYEKIVLGYKSTREHKLY